MRFEDLVLRAIVFIAGAVVMVVELAGGRAITALYGSSAVVWGGVIGVVLTALSSGYWIGGRLSDRFDPRKVVIAMALVGGIYVTALPTVTALASSVFRFELLEERIGSVLSASIVTGVPSLLLGAVVPAAVKQIGQGRQELGTVSGNVYALSTLGSIAGTFGTTFFLLQYLEVNSIFLLSGLTLSAIGLVGAVRHPGMLKAGAIAVVLSVLVTSPSFLVCTSAYIGDVKYVGDSAYSRIVVVERAGTRLLYINGLLHSGMVIGVPDSLPFAYTRLFVLGPLINGKTRNATALFIGGGGFSGPKFFASHYPGMRIVAVEVDEKVVEVARRFFHLDEFSDRIEVVVMDGRRYLMVTDAVFDVVVLDAYSKNYIPFHLATSEFFGLLRSRVREGGVVVSNVIASLAGPTSAILWAYVRTLTQHFPHVLIVPVSSGDPYDVQNVIVVASDAPLPDTRTLLDRASTDPVASQLGLEGPISRAFVPSHDLSQFPLLTDGYSPIENLMNPVTMSRFGERYTTGLGSPSLCA
ncbi:MAG: fused MFS/spermidine synthase [Aigarchaeota archaeon]|nr:fused MFS/spermidine synthase [Candidatus Calditenuis fumarioli]